MAGTRTAPLMTVAATYDQVSVRWIDASGDLRADSFNVPAATTNLQIETVLTDLQERSNASIYELSRKSIWVGAKTKTNATTDPRSESVFDNIVLHFKDLVTQADQRLFIPAALEATLLDGTDTPNVTDLADVATGAVVALGGNFAWRSARYTERREINESVSP